MVARHIAPRMVPCYMFFCSLTAFITVACRIALRMTPCCSFFRSSGFPIVLRAVFLSGWQHIAVSATCRWFSRFACCIAQCRVADCSFFPSSTAFTTVYMPCRSFFWSSTNFLTFRMLYSSMYGSALLVLPLADGFHGLCAVLLRGWRRIAHSSIHHRLL